MRNSRLSLFLVLLLTAGCSGRQTGTGAARVVRPPGLSICFTDVEGGAATLIVTPAGETLLIDSGFPGERDAARIRQAAEEAGAGRIDHYITTHWHLDHMGGVGQLSEKIPIDRFYDHGLDPAYLDPGTDPALVDAYRRVAADRARVLQAGDEIPLRQAPGLPPVSLRCVISNSLTVDGGILPAPLPSPDGKVEPLACGHLPKPPDPSDNARSLGFLLKFGDFEFLDLGDLTWNVEHLLVCPRNRLGPVDLYQVTHHGNDSSNNPALLQAVSPRVAVVNNGPRKGGAAQVYADLKAVEGIEAIYQVHRNVATGPESNAAPEFIANLEETCEGEPILVHVSAHGESYRVKVGRRGAARVFASR